MALCESKRLFTNEIWRFAYEDGGGKYSPRLVKDADIRIKIPEDVWQEKYKIITEIYGFGPDSFEAKAVVREEAFWCFKQK